MVDVFSPEYLYTSDKSPVQYGSIYEIKRYLNKAKPTGLKGYLKDLDEYAKKIELGTHQGASLGKRESITQHCTRTEMNFSNAI